MEPASDETGKETNSNDDNYVEKNEEPAADENEFLKCSRKGRRDACPDIHCKCSESDQEDKCLFHKEALESDLKESEGEKTWHISLLRALFALLALNTFWIRRMLFICGPSGNKLMFKRVVYFGENLNLCEKIGPFLARD